QRLEVAARVGTEVDALLEPADEARREGHYLNPQAPQLEGDVGMLDELGRVRSLVDRELDLEPCARGGKDAVQPRRMREGAAVLHGGPRQRLLLELDAEPVGVGGRAEQPAFE